MKYNNVRRNQTKKKQNHIVYSLFGNGENGSELDDWATKVSVRGIDFC